jgi:hypothetical protein
MDLKPNNQSVWTGLQGSKINFHYQRSPAVNFDLAIVGGLFDNQVLLLQASEDILSFSFKTDIALSDTSKNHWAEKSQSKFHLGAKTISNILTKFRCSPGT